MLLGDFAPEAPDDDLAVEKVADQKHAQSAEPDKYNARRHSAKNQRMGGNGGEHQESSPRGQNHVNGKRENGELKFPPLDPLRVYLIKDAHSNPLMEL